MCLYPQIPLKLSHSSLPARLSTNTTEPFPPLAVLTSVGYGTREETFSRVIADDRLTRRSCLFSMELVALNTDVPNPTANNHFASDISTRSVIPDPRIFLLVKTYL